MGHHADATPTGDPLELATVELIGALAYGQLRSLEATARLIRLAPDARRADQAARAVSGEHAAYVQLREHLAARTQLPSAVMDRQKAAFDGYFDRAPLDDWFGACVFFALGLPIAADFARDVAPSLDTHTAEVVTGALADRDTFAHGATTELAALLTDEHARDRARHLAGDILGRALTSFQAVVSGTDALRVLLTASHPDEPSGEARVKQLAIAVLDGHRRRAVQLGLEQLDDVR